jgi:hypothetical protein
LEGLSNCAATVLRLSTALIAECFADRRLHHPPLVAMLFSCRSHSESTKDLHVCYNRSADIAYRHIPLLRNRAIFFFNGLNCSRYQAA